MVLSDDVDYFVGHAKALGHIDTELDVGAFSFGGLSLADIVQESAELDGLDVSTELSSDSGSDFGFFESVEDHILTVAEAILEAAEESNQLFGQSMDAELTD